MLAVLYSHFFWIFGTFHCAFVSYGNYNLNIYIHVYTRNDARNFNYRYVYLSLTPFCIQTSEPSLAWRTLLTLFSAKRLRSSASSNSCCALRYFAKLMAAISSASSICFL